MNNTLIEVAATFLLFGAIGVMIGMALWIGLKKPEPQPKSDDFCVREAEALLYHYQLERQWER